MPATVIRVIDFKKPGCIEHVEFQKTPTPQEEAAAVARLELKYAGEEGIEVEVIHGPTVADITSIYKVT